MRTMASLLPPRHKLFPKAEKSGNMYLIMKKKTVFVGAVELVFEFSDFEFNLAIWVILEKFRD